MLDSSTAVVGTEQSSVQWEDTKLEPGVTPTADRSENAPDSPAPAQSPPIDSRSLLSVVTPSVLGRLQGGDASPGRAWLRTS